ncbi:MAG: FkbM family methyltransferase, partial [Bacteroidota bacterium]
MEINIRHRQFTVEPGQNAAAWAHINQGTWEPDTFDMLDRFVQPGDVVLDLGSWSGVISLYIADKASRVFAVDPDPVCFAELTTNIARNPDVAQKVKALQVAVSDQQETLHLSARAQYGQSSSSILQRARDAERSHALTTLPLA